MLGTALFAQSPETTSQTYQEYLAQNYRHSNPSFQQSVRPWSEGPLRWDEFQGTINADSATHIDHLSLSTEVEVADEKVGNTRYLYPKFVTYFNRAESWARPQFENDTILRFHQLLFDMRELYGRRATIEYNRSSGDVQLDQLASFYFRQFENRAKVIQDETRYGSNAEKFSYHAADVALDLMKTQFDPVTALDGASLGMNGNLAFGANAMFPISEYFSQAFGFNMYLAAGWKQHQWGLDMTFGFGAEAEKDFDTKNGWIMEGQSLNVYQVYATYAYCTSRTSNFQAYPYVGLGVVGIMHPGDRGDDDYHAPEKIGFSVCAGMMFDVVLRRTVRLKPVYSYSTERADVRYYGITVRPYFSLTHFNEFGWTPAINLNLSFNMGAYDLR